MRLRVFQQFIGVLALVVGICGLADFTTKDIPTRLGVDLAPRATLTYETQDVFFPLVDTCHGVSNRTSVRVVLPESQEYKHEQTRYWSIGNGHLKPSCILYPDTPENVARIVSILSLNDERFAVKSGGHSANAYFSSIHGGPLISTKHLNHVVLDIEAQTVRVGPGNRWEDVTAALDGTGYTVVGGRIGDVGVGGYILGGGLSFLSTQHGWAANNVVEYEMVLANSTVIRASATSHAEVFAALKGGGNHFGIITSYLLKAHPIGEVWGGRYMFTAGEATNSAMLRAVRDFTEYYPDPKAGIILVANTAAFGFIDVWLLFLFYDGPKPPSGVFDNFTRLDPFLDTTKTQTFDQLLRGNDWAIVKDSHYFLGTETMALPAADKVDETLREIHQYWRSESSKVYRTLGMIASIVYQPLPKSMARIARQNGGDVLDLDDDVDRLVIEVDYSLWFRRDLEKIGKAYGRTWRGIDERIRGMEEDGRLEKAYNPLFMNDAGWEQDYFGRLRPEKKDLVKRVQGEVDPHGLWKRSGGFRV